MRNSIIGIVAAAATLAATVIPASAAGIFIGPRGGVSVGLGGGGYGYRRPFYGPRIYTGRSAVVVRPGFRRGYGYRY